MRWPTALVALAYVTSAAVAEGPRFTHVPRDVRGMSADGTIVFANGPYEQYSNTGLIYNLAEGTVTAITNPPVRAGITAITSLGNYVAGGSPTGSPASAQAYRFSIDGNHTLIGKRPGTASSSADAISGDGNVLAGVSDLHGNGVTRFPFRWTPQTGRQEIGPANGLLSGDVRDISRDGTTIVGSGGPIGGNGSLGWVWRESTGFSYLPSLANVEGTIASAVSADGSIIVGTSRLSFQAADKLIVRWIGDDLQSFPMPPGLVNPSIEDVSDDGNIMVGGVTILGGGGSWGMICTPELGIMLASEYLAMHGLTLPEGVGIRRIYAVSADGMTFGGSLSTGTGFVATVPAPATAALLAAAGLVAARRRRV
ncbi:MAG: hypothetical protein KF859_13255 [Phycisphaeraceae bacterium]|nr:hypothetical protein [Phycisphaeraceae bacterium]